MTRRPARFVWLDTVTDRVRQRAISSHAGHVAFVLAVHYVNGHKEAWPSQQTLAAATGYSVSTVRRAVHELEQDGLLEVRRGRPAHTSSNTYRLTNSP